MISKNNVVLIVVVVVILLITLGFFIKNGNNIKKGNEINASLLKENIEKKQTWHTENDEKYVDDEYKFSAQYPKGWFLKENLPVGSNEGDWKRRVSFSNYDFKNNYNINNLPDDYKLFEFILDNKEDCEKALLKGHKMTDDINVWKKSFDNIYSTSEEFKNLSVTDFFQFGDFCLDINFSDNAFAGKNVTTDEKIDIIKIFAKSFQIQEQK